MMAQLCSALFDVPNMDDGQPTLSYNWSFHFNFEVDFDKPKHAYFFEVTIECFCA